MNNSNAEIQSALWDMFVRFNIGTNHANVLAYETLALHITIMKNTIKLIVMFYFEIHFYIFGPAIEHVYILKYLFTQEGAPTNIIMLQNILVARRMFHSGVHVMACRLFTGLAPASIIFGKKAAVVHN